MFNRHSKFILSTALGLIVLITTPLPAEQDVTRVISKKKELVEEYVSDAAVTANVKAALAAEPHFPSTSVHVVTKNSVVQLNGIVRNNVQKQQAETVTRNLKGVKDVSNNLKIRPHNLETSEKNQPLREGLDDTAVTAAVKAKLMIDPNLDAGNIKVTTLNNSVELKGTVRSLVEKERAEKIASNVEGAEKVVNNLVVTEK